MNKPTGKGLFIGSLFIGGDCIGNHLMVDSETGRLQQFERKVALNSHGETGRSTLITQEG